MENGQKTSSVRIVSYDVGHVREVIRQANQELWKLSQQRTEVMRRIATVKRTIAGLANLCGDGVLSDELREVIEPNGKGRRRGFTKACRMILMEAGDAVRASDICDNLQQKMPLMLARHKDPIRSVVTVLDRLVQYGEARAVLSSNGTRAWFWVAEPAEPPPVQALETNHSL